jgi:hypothetical protein
METVACEAGGVTVAGLIVDDGTGQYFAIAWDELLRFRVPARYLAGLEAVVTGAEPVAGGDVSGFGGDRPAGQANTLIAELAAAAPSDRERFAARRLRVWALLR